MFENSVSAVFIRLENLEKRVDILEKKQIEEEPIITSVNKNTFKVGELYKVLSGEHNEKILMFISYREDLLKFCGIDGMWYFDIHHGFNHSMKRVDESEYPGICHIMSNKLIEAYYNKG